MSSDKKGRSLPSGWLQVAFSDLNQYQSANVDPAEHPAEMFELYSVPNFPNGVPELQTGAEIGSTKQTVKPDDVLICKINPRINRVWKVPGASDKRQIGSSEWIVFRSPQTNADFFKYYFRSDEFRKPLCKDVTGVGGSLTRAQPSRVATFILPLPPLPEQVRIADKLDTLLSRVSSGRERLERMQKLLKQFRQSVLSAAVSGELTREWRGGGDAEWENVTLGDVALDIRYGTAQKCDYYTSGIPVLRIPNVSGGVINTDDLKYAQFTEAERKKLALESGDILVIRSNGSADLVGLPTLVTASHEGYLYAGYLIRLRFRPTIHPSFVWRRLSAPDIRSDIKANARSSSGVHNINTEELRAIAFSLPSLPEQAEIVRRVESLFALADSLEERYAQTLQAFETLTPALLAKAFRGELVPQDPSDEPASVLLERIRAEQAVKAKKPKQTRKTSGETGAGGTGKRGRPRKNKAASEDGLFADVSQAKSVEEAIALLEAQKARKRLQMLQEVLEVATRQGRRLGMADLHRQYRSAFPNDDTSTFYATLKQLSPHLIAEAVQPETPWETVSAD